jgi:glycosyltransferase involved in cell wall biosynthesis
MVFVCAAFGWCLLKTWLVSAVGVASDPLTWSGTVYHFKTATDNLMGGDSGLELNPYAAGIRARRCVWNMWKMLSDDRFGGFQYSPCFLEALWGPVQKRIGGHDVVNCFQLYAPSVLERADVRKWFYVDQTLLQLFDYYKQRASVGSATAQEALCLEKQGYEHAQGVVAMSHFAAKSMREDCGVPAEKVHVVVPGANIHPEVYEAWYAEASAPKPLCEPLCLVIVVSDWRRKGLDRLLRALVLARARGVRIRVKVVGCVQADVPLECAAVEGVEWLGRIDKRIEPKKFLEVVADADVGCLLSYYEAGGMVLREFHALGLAVLATDAGGMLDHMYLPSAHVLKHTASDEDIMEALCFLDDNPLYVHALRMQAWCARREGLWDESVKQLKRIVYR